jgi:hypothetical protein
MCEPRFLEERAQFFRAAKSRLRDINIAANLSHEAICDCHLPEYLGLPLIKCVCLLRQWRPASDTV